MIYNMKWQNVCSMIFILLGWSPKRIRTTYGGTFQPCSRQYESDKKDELHKRANSAACNVASCPIDGELN